VATRLQRENAELHGVMSRLDVLHACVSAPEVLKAAPAHGFDLIVSNPPYIKTCEWQVLQPEVKTWESREALDGGEDGLDVVRMILSSSLAIEGRALQEHGQGRAVTGADVNLARSTNNRVANRLNCDVPSCHSSSSGSSGSSILDACGVIWMELDVDQPIYLQEKMQNAASAGAWWSISSETDTILRNENQPDSSMCVMGGREKIEVEAVFEDFTGRTRFCKLAKGCQKMH
jgi:methylase of polypeptide subunit release factors